MPKAKKKNCLPCSTPSIGKCWGCGKPVLGDQSWFAFVICDEGENPNDFPMKYAHQQCDRLVQSKVRDLAARLRSRENGNPVIGGNALSGA